MKTLLSAIVAAAFAAAGFNAVAQSKDVTTKSGGGVTSAGGTPVQTKEPKEKPKGGPAPTMPQVEKKPKKEKPATTEVKTKSGGAVTTKDKKDVTSTK